MTAPQAIQYKPGSLDREIAPRVLPGRSRAITAREMAKRYAVLCQSALPHFAPDEWRLLARMAAVAEGVGRTWTGVLAWQTSVHLTIAYNTLELSIADLHSYASLFDRVRGLSDTEALAAFDMTEQILARFHGGDDVVLGEAGWLTPEL